MIDAITIGGAVFAVFATIISGAVWVVGLVTRVAGKIKEVDMKVEALEKKIISVDSRTISDQKDNEAFRHKYKTTVEGLVELIKIKFEDLDKNFARFEELIRTQIELAIAKNNEKK